MVIDEKQMLDMLTKSSRYLLVEANYRADYLPLGLMKVASYIRANNPHAIIEYGRKPISGFDIIAMTSLFTYESTKVKEALDEATKLGYSGDRLLVGGIFASLMPSWFEDKYDLRLFTGYSKVLDSVYPSYELDWNAKERFKAFHPLFTTRGCPNKCPYCAVWRIEGRVNVEVVPNWRDIIQTDKKAIMISDNNLTLAPREHTLGLLNYLAESKKIVKFNNGFDVKFIDDEVAEAVGRVRLDNAGLAIAFDRMDEDGVFQTAVEKLLKWGTKPSKIMTFVLFNFVDTPQDAYYRAKEAQRYNTFPYVIPYRHLRSLDRKSAFVGQNWTSNLIKCFRQYWLFAGFYKKMPFEDAVISDKYGMKFNMTDEDWEKWNNKEVAKSN